MNAINKLLIFICTILLSSCNYLDIVPDEKASEEDAFKDAAAAERYLYSCYSRIPNPRDGTNSLDLWTGDEIVTPWETGDFGKFIQGLYTPSKPCISGFWNDMFSGIRQCYLLKNNLGSVPNLPQDSHDTFMAEADFLIAYYHYSLIRAYGPSILVKELPDTDNNDIDRYLGRNPYDECVEWVAELFRDAATRLPDKWSGADYGRATSVAAMSLRARMYLYAASPQFNGGDKFKQMYDAFKNLDGTQMISTTFDQQKWEKAKEACLQAIQKAESPEAGHTLYEAQAGALVQTPEPVDMHQRSLRFTYIDKDNTQEVIWGWCQKEGSSSLVQKETLPRWNDLTWGGTATTLNQVERFYTENGLPIDEDPDYQYPNRFNVTTFAAGDPNGEGETLVLNTKREPRFYAWVAFHNGYYEVFGTDNSTTGKTSPYAPQFKRGINKAKLLTQFRYADNCGRNDRGTGSLSGYLNKKGANPGTTVEKTVKLVEYPWPMIRLAELFLNYAEACVECNDLATAKIYLNKVRHRAGIPDVETSWARVPGTVLDQNKMRQIVRRERQIELYFENHSVWDLRRWGEAEVLGQKPRGLALLEKDLARFGVATDVDVQRRFTPANYLLPIYSNDINENPNMVQNPKYNE